MNLNIKLVCNVFKKYTDIYESVLLKLFKEKKLNFNQYIDIFSSRKLFFLWLG